MDKVDLFNELCTLAMSYFVIVFSAFYHDAEVKYNVGWYTISLFVFNFLSNVGIILYQTISGIRKNCKKKKGGAKAKVQNFDNL